jgi:DNA helicase HerA-like ATPase
VPLIRSKGVGVYFICQNPLAIPEAVLGQLGTRVQHALRAFTPKDQKAVKAAAETFRANPNIDTVKAITELQTGEALVSVLDENGSPTPVEKILIRPPHSRIGPMSNDERQTIMDRSPLKGRYEETIDHESAHEILKKRPLKNKEWQLPKKRELNRKNNRNKIILESLIGKALAKQY